MQEGEGAGAPLLREVGARDADHRQLLRHVDDPRFPPVPASGARFRQAIRSSPLSQSSPSHSSPSSSPSPSSGASSSSGGCQTARTSSSLKPARTRLRAPVEEGLGALRRLLGDGEELAGTGGAGVFDSAAQQGQVTAPAAAPGLERAGEGEIYASLAGAL